MQLPANHLATCTAPVDDMGLSMSLQVSDKQHMSLRDLYKPTTLFPTGNTGHSRLHITTLTGLDSFGK